MSFCDNLRSLREKKGLSIAAMSEKFSLDESVIKDWESGLSVPDAETLTRLHSELDEGVQDEALPGEVYMVVLSADEVQEAHASVSKVFIKRRVRDVLIFALLLAWSIIGRLGDAEIGVAAGILFVFVVLLIREIRASKVGVRDAIKRIPQTRIEYCIYPDFMRVSTWEGRERIAETKLFYDEARQCVKNDKYLLPIFGTGYRIIPLSAIAHRSILRNAFPLKPVKQKTLGKAKTAKSIRTASIVLLVLSFISLPLGALIHSRIFMAFAMDNMWFLLLVAIFPLASLILGVVMLRKRLKLGLLNVILGIIVLSLLYHMALSYFDPHYYAPSHSEEHYSDGIYVESLENAEKLLTIDFPEPMEYIAAQDDISIYYNDAYYRTSVSFGPEDSDAFEENMDSRWMSYVPTAFSGFCKGRIPMDDYDRYLFFNMNTGEYNTLPSEDGSYSFLSAYYSSEQNSLVLVEHQVDFRQ